MNRGRFAWYALLTDDLPSARAFYTALMGWKESPWCEGTYDFWTAGEAAVAGALRLPDEAHAAGPHWLGYVAVDDVDATVRRAERLGGKVLKAPADLPNMGRFAVLADPQGAAFAVSAITAADGNCAAGDHFVWNELNSTDAATAWKFYAELFGWVETGSFSMGPEWGTYTMFGDAPHRAMGGMFDGARVSGTPASWVYCLRVADADEAARRVAALGGKVLHGPADIPAGSGRVAHCMDPRGARFAIASGT